MSTAFLAEVKIVSFGYAPRGWATCDGQLLPINQNQALFSLLGTMYGGDGRTNFALPDLRGRAPIHYGDDRVGQSGGEEGHTLTPQEMPQHTHPVNASSGNPTTGVPTNATFAASSQSAYAGTSNALMSPSCVTSVGGSQAHQNMPPYLVLNFVIALQGIFPSQS